MFAAMVGFREATGMAPPPPVTITERAEWLAPEPEKDDAVGVVFEDPAPFESDVQPPDEATAEHGLAKRTWAALRSLVGRT